MHVHSADKLYVYMCCNENVTFVTCVSFHVFLVRLYTCPTHLQPDVFFEMRGDEEEEVHVAAAAEIQTHELIDREMQEVTAKKKKKNLTVFHLQQRRPAKPLEKTAFVSLLVWLEVLKLMRRKSVSADYFAHPVEKRCGRYVLNRVCVMCSSVMFSLMDCYFDTQVTSTFVSVFFLNQNNWEVFS